MLRCGVAGLGRGRQFADVLSILPDCQVVAVCDPNPAARQRLQGITAHERFDDLLDEKLDIVAIISPGPVHAEQTLAALDQLPDHQRQPIVLVAIEDMSYADAAKTLDVPLGTFMSRLGRGREALRKIMTGCKTPKLRLIA